MSATIIKHSKRTLRSGCKYCGSKNVYWGHDTAVSGDKYCDDCGTDGKFLLIDQDGNPHTMTCPAAKGRDNTPPETTKDETVTDAVDVFEAIADGRPVTSDGNRVTGVATAPPVSSTGHGVDPAYAAFQALIAGITPTMDRDEIRAVIKEEFSNVVYPTRTVVQRADGTTKPIEGKTHTKVADVITDLLAGEHVMMVGPAGTGKSTIAEQAAEALGLECYAISCSPMMPASQLLGYMQAAGEYVGSLFRQAYEHGGLFHFDEIDNSHPSVLAVINQALANGHMAFPDAMVKRHADFRCVASANTYGKGADRAYVGRQAIDAATLDRFTIETIEIDETLEYDLCMSTGLEAGEVGRVLTTVRRYRRNAADKRMTVVLSPRASVGMCRLLQAGRTWEEALETRVRRGMSDADWSKLTSA